MGWVQNGKINTSDTDINGKDSWSSEPEGLLSYESSRLKIPQLAALWIRCERGRFSFLTYCCLWSTHITVLQLSDGSDHSERPEEACQNQLGTKAGAPECKVLSLWWHGIAVLVNPGCESKTGNIEIFINSFINNNNTITLP